MASIDLDDLAEELSSALGQVNCWAYAKVASADELRDKHLRKLQEDVARKSTLQQQHAELVAQAEALQIRLAQETRREEELRTALERIKAAAAPLPQRLDELRDAAEREARELQRREAALADEEALREGKLRSLREAVKLHQQRLGLRFQHHDDSSGELLLVFTQIAAQDPAREYVLGVRVPDSNSFEVTQCRPALDNINDLQAKLNVDRNFGAFVKAVRREFKALAA
ncbi:hypothetical protein WJX81_003030 [Elliptochloris bilobata]|uniref:Kinetochore protein SPC25 n=1 Tax=Elliptochloris bilobata TaxID=381761 RepID=A0AAW1SBS7_9CHLO